MRKGGGEAESYSAPNEILPADFCDSKFDGAELQQAAKLDGAVSMDLLRRKNHRVACTAAGLYSATCANALKFYR